jgi:hypothetical protein
MALRAGHDERRVAELVARVHVGAAVEQERHDLDVVAQDRMEERRTLLAVATIDDGAGVDEVADDVEPAGLGGEAECGAASDVRLVDGCALGPEPADERQVARVLGREEHGRSVEVVPRLDGRAELERALDGATVAPPDGVEEPLLERERLGIARLARAERAVLRAGAHGGRPRRGGRRVVPAAAERDQHDRAGHRTSERQPPAIASLISGATICMPGSSLL